jgi:hypothetical protein
MSKSKELRFPAYPVVNFVPSFSSDAETLPVLQTGSDKLIVRESTRTGINTTVDAIQPPPLITGLASWMATQARLEPVVAPGADSKLLEWYIPICSHLSTFDVLFSVSFFGLFFGTIYVLAKFL